MKRRVESSVQTIHANTQKRKQTASIIAPKPPPQRSQIAIANIAKLESKTVGHNNLVKYWNKTSTENGSSRPDILF